MVGGHASWRERLSGIAKSAHSRLRRHQLKHRFLPSHQARGVPHNADVALLPSALSSFFYPPVRVRLMAHVEIAHGRQPIPVFAPWAHHRAGEGQRAAQLTLQSRNNRRNRAGAANDFPRFTARRPSERQAGQVHPTVNMAPTAVAMRKVDVPAAGVNLHVVFNNRDRLCGGKRLRDRLVGRKTAPTGPAAPPGWATSLAMSGKAPAHRGPAPKIHSHRKWKHAGCG